MKGKSINKVIIIMLLLFLVGCNKPELNYFSNMADYPHFNNVKDKTVLCGIDRTRIIQNRRGEYFLSTPKDALFNIESELFLKDSIVYIKTKNFNNKDTVQVLFDFKPTEYQKHPSDTIPEGRSYSYMLPDSSRIVYVAVTSYNCLYSRNKQLYDIDITNRGSRYYSEIDDFVTDFMIEKSKAGQSWIDNTFYLQISLKKGIVKLTYLDRDSIYYIDIFNHTIFKDVNPLKEVDYLTQ